MAKCVHCVTVFTGIRAFLSSTCEVSGQFAVGDHVVRGMQYGVNFVYNFYTTIAIN